jgi:hypothetical protein
MLQREKYRYCIAAELSDREEEQQITLIPVARNMPVLHEKHIWTRAETVHAG